jgi:hypothetical protein
VNVVTNLLKLKVSEEVSVFDYNQGSADGYNHHFAMVEYREISMHVSLPQMMADPEYRAYVIKRAERTMMKDLQLYLEWCKANFGRRGKRWRGCMTTAANNAHVAALSFRDDADAVLFKLAFPEAII